MDLKIFSDTVEHSALQQIYALKNHPAFKYEKVRIMPDVHAGSGCVIGFTSTFTDKIIPDLIGVDIGCGVDAVCLRETENPWDGHLKALDEAPMAYKSRAEVLSWIQGTVGDFLTLRPIYNFKAEDKSK